MQFLHFDVQTIQIYLCDGSKQAWLHMNIECANYLV